MEADFEQYAFGHSNIINVSFGKYSSRVYDKHCKKYGEIAAGNIRDNVRKTFLETLKQLNDIQKNNNMLLIGKVQSGKTSNLEMFTALAFDNGYNCVIIYGGYDTKLLEQTCTRFKKTFDIDGGDEIDDAPELFSTGDGKAVDSLDESLVDSILASGKPLIFVSMKKPVALTKVNTVLANLPKSKLKAFIIDDEGDQASLNTEFKKDKKSATYYQIVTMKKVLNNPLYLSVTATPQANVLLGEYSELKPDGLRLIEPGNGYTGGESFHTKEDNIILIEDNSEVDSYDPKSVSNAIRFFLVASTIMKKRGIKSKNVNYSDMIIHTSRSKLDHQDLYDFVVNYISSLQDNIVSSDEDLVLQLNEIKKAVYNKSYFNEDVLSANSFDDLKEDLVDVIKNTHVILQDGNGKVTQEHEKYKHHKIYIGGDLLQRGLTFEYLVATYFTRWPKNSGNMDTIIQRARWFGYRGKYLDLCRIFTTEKIMFEYASLTEIENDLWEQCYEIEDGQKKIDDIIIDATATSLKPTRSNVVNYRRIKFATKWSNQKFGVFDKNILSKINEYVDKLFAKLVWSGSTVGRTDDRLSNYYSEIKYEDFCNLLKNTKEIFDVSPFSVKDLIDVCKGKKIVIERLYDLPESEEKIRERSFDSNNHISALQQGADKTEYELQKYKGDSYVIVDPTAITVQVFKIRPKINKLPHSEYDQFMFSIHLPESKEGFRKC